MGTDPTSDELTCPRLDAIVDGLFGRGAIRTARIHTIKKGTSSFNFYLSR